MAKLAVTFLVFLLFTLSYARTPVDLPKNDVIDVDSSDSLPGSVIIKPTILLPTEKPETLPSIDPELDTETPETKPVNEENRGLEQPTETSAESDAVNAVPLTKASAFVSFRPINRHFPRRPFPLRFPARPCLHHFKQMKRSKGPEISYGNDMILSDLTTDFDPAAIHGGVRRIPARWVRLHHHRHHHDNDGIPSFSFKRQDMFGKEKFKKHFHHEEGQDQEIEKKKERQESEKGRFDFMKGIRKFMNHF